MKEEHMVENILVGIFCVIVAAAAVWAWWLENGGDHKKK
jgi:hypothetical protein